MNDNIASPDHEKPIKDSKGRAQLRQWLNKSFRIKMTDGRVLYGTFACTDRDGNIILASCSEYLSEHSDPSEERVLGLIMVPGRHIVSIQVDDMSEPRKLLDCSSKLSSESVTPEE
uniref:Putative u1 snrnp component n=1 Tax=Xenopsylla cheopis TaxID=163159 RepID=A0A6M2DCG5_XENCH